MNSLNDRFDVHSQLIISGLMTIAMLTLSACSDENPVDPTRTNSSYFPLAVGNHWLYGMEDPVYGDNFSWTVVQMNGDTALVERPWLDVGPQFQPVTVVQDGPDYLVRVGESQWDLFYRFMPDSTWAHRSPFDCDDHLVFKTTLDTTTIVTPAGSFRNTLKLERQTTANCADAGVMYEWWAPGVGLVKWEELNFYAGGPITGHLIQYHLSDN